MRHLNLEKFRAAKLETAPFLYVIVPGFLKQDSVRAVNATFPAISKGGSFPLHSVDDTATIKDVIAELDGAEFEDAVAEKFGVPLSGKPKIYSLRGHLRARDGQIHTDSKDKIITVLLYLNEHWENSGGRLRLLKNGTDLDSYVAEVPPENGNLLVFKRSENSWHGHHPFEGPRRALQMNWMTDVRSRGLHALRHQFSAVLKRLRPTQRDHF
jgi:SM-20-related protein